MPGADARMPAGSRSSTRRGAPPGGWGIAAADGFYEEQVELARSLGDPRGLANALFNLSHTRVVGGDPAASEAIRAEAIQRYEEIGDARGAARVSWIAANVLTVTDPAAATVMLEDLLSRYVELDDRFYIAMASGTLSWSLIGTGQYEAALDHALRTVDLAREAGDIGAATIAVREVDRVPPARWTSCPAAILEGALSTCPTGTGSARRRPSPNARRIWPGPELSGRSWARTIRDPSQHGGRNDARRSRGLHRGERGRIRQARPAISARPSHRLSSHGTPAAHGPVVYAGEPGAFAEDACSPPSATSTASRRQFPRRVRGSQLGRPTRPASFPSRTWSTARSARTTT